MNQEDVVQQSCAWCTYLAVFVESTEDVVLSRLGEHHLRCMGSVAVESQQRAWVEEVRVLQHCAKELVGAAPETARWTLILEYELPRERGRRPDAIMLTQRGVIVLEFKSLNVPLQAHIDQVTAYRRDLAHYHAASHSNDVACVLVLMGKTGNASTEAAGLSIVGPQALARTALALAATARGPAIEPQTWLRADYEALPSLVAAARAIFQHEPLPAIRRAHSAGIPATIQALSAIATTARAKGERHLALVTGVPGAGKTLVGLQFVYNAHTASDTDKTAVFLSGNGPLVKVLQHALKSSIFVQDVHGFLKQYGGASNRLPGEHIWVYDEAQRAWDEKRVMSKRGHAASEPEDFLRIGERMPNWSLMIGLIGEGQEIHIGEEAGIRQWDEAIGTLRGAWIVHCASKLRSIFTSAQAVVCDERLDLSCSLRSHLAADVQSWISNVLDGRFREAASLAPKIKEEGFDFYVTRSLDNSIAYVRDRYRGEPDKRFGLLASSKAKILSQYGVQNGFNFTRQLREGPWYNDPPESRLSCCQLRDVATEFACQGLELDFPIVCWGDDLTWDGSSWVSPPATRSSARDPHRLRINSYRVLLSRGRDGFAVFVPPTVEMDATCEALSSGGLATL